MFASFEYRLTSDEYSNGLRVGTVAMVAADRWRVVWCLGQIAVIGTGMWIAVALRLATFDGILLTFCLTAVPLLLMQTICTKRYRGLSYEPDAAQLRLTFDEDGLIERNNSAEHRWTWDGVRRICELPDAVVLQVAGWHLITLPDRLWADARERATFVRQLRDHSTKLLPDLRPSTLAVGTGSLFLTIGAVAAGLDLMSLIQFLMHAAGVDDCSSTVRQCLTYQVAGPFVILGTLITIWLTKLRLERLRKSRPRLAWGIALVLIAPQLLLLAMILPRCLR